MKAKTELIDGGAAVTIPASVMSLAGVSLGVEVDIYVEDGYVVLAKAGRNAFVDRLVDSITSINFHKEIETGGPVGNEAP